ncbi:PRE C2HC domain-containing protein [Aphis craccivora]|uniref:PRE C2HC domain-containing protein n=1 Tax=Aphis craccivora TaxID=307492 RepID=A0A6G0YZ98_APHCR|nr:PRE C2HC domain-containing protein [Aphis craccivora]
MSRLNTPNKLKLSSTSLISSWPKAGDNKSKIFFSTNKYAALVDNFDSSTEVFSTPPVPISPSIQDAFTVDSKSPVTQPLDVEHLKSPPIFIKNISNLMRSRVTLSVLRGRTEYFMDDNKDYSFHIFCPRHLRPIKAVICNIHHSTALEEIETALSLLGFSVDHFSEECVKPCDLPAKCALWAGYHTANFKGCPSYKKFIMSKNKKTAFRSNSNTNVQTPTKVSSNEVLGDHARQLPRKSYAAATKTVTSSMESISNVLSKFISNFNSLITPLINLLTEVVNKRFCP